MVFPMVFPIWFNQHIFPEPRHRPPPQSEDFHHPHQANQAAEAEQGHAEHVRFLAKNREWEKNAEDGTNLQKLGCNTVYIYIYI